MTKKKHRVTVFDFISNASNITSTNNAVKIKQEKKENELILIPQEVFEEVKEEKEVEDGSSNIEEKKKKRRQKKKNPSQTLLPHVKPDEFVTSSVPESLSYQQSELIPVLNQEVKEEKIILNKAGKKEKPLSKLKKNILKEREQAYDNFLTTLVEQTSVHEKLANKEDNDIEKEKIKNETVLSPPVSCPWVITISGLPYSNSTDFYRTIVQKLPTKPNFWGLYTKIEEEKLQEIIEKDEKDEIKKEEKTENVEKKRKNDEEKFEDSIPSHLGRRKIYLELFFHEKKGCQRAFSSLLTSGLNCRLKYSNKANFYYKKKENKSRKSKKSLNNREEKERSSLRYYNNSSLRISFSKTANSFSYRFYSELNGEKIVNKEIIQKKEDEISKQKIRLRNFYESKEEEENDEEGEEEEEIIESKQREIERSLILTNFFSEAELKELNESRIPEDIEESLSSISSLYSSYSSLFSSRSKGKGIKEITVNRLKDCSFSSPSSSSSLSLYLSSFFSSLNHDKNTIDHPSHISLCFRSLVSLFNSSFLLEKFDSFFDFKRSFILSEHKKEISLYDFLFSPSLSSSLVIVNFCSIKTWRDKLEREELRNELLFLIEKYLFIPPACVKIEKTRKMSMNKNKKYKKNISLKISISSSSYASPSLLLLKIYDFLSRFLFLKKQYQIILYCKEDLFFDSRKSNHLLFIPIKRPDQGEERAESENIKSPVLPQKEKKIFSNIFEKEKILNILKINCIDLFTDLISINHLYLPTLNLSPTLISSSIPYEVHVKLSDMSSFLMFQAIFSNNLLFSPPLLNIYSEKIYPSLQEKEILYSYNPSLPYNSITSSSFPLGFSNSLRNFTSNLFKQLESYRKEVNYIFYEFFSPLPLSDKFFAKLSTSHPRGHKKFPWIPTLNFLELKQKEKLREKEKNENAKDSLILKLSEDEERRKKLSTHLIEMLKSLGTFQRKLKDLNSFMYKRKMRYVVGLKQVRNLYLITI